MKTNKTKIPLISLCILLCVHSCTPTEKEQIISDTPETPAKTDSIPTEKPAQNFDIYSISERFLEKVRNSVPHCIIYLPNTGKKVPYHEAFPKENLVKSTLYLRKEAENYSEIRYTDIFLMVLEYSSENESLIAFNTLIEKLKDGITHSAMEENEKRIILKDIDPYHGGFIIRKEKYIISLGKKCGNNKLNLNFEEYEKLFLIDFQHSKEDSKIIKSRCGEPKFTIK